MIAADEFLAHARGKALIGDTGYDSNRFLRAVRDKGMRPVIHAKPERPRKHRLVRKLYRQRYLVEVFFHDLKRLRAIATRYEKTARNFLALVQVACAWLWTRELGTPTNAPAGPAPVARSTHGRVLVSPRPARQAPR
jgi:transposase